MKQFLVQRWFLLLLAIVLTAGFGWSAALEPAADAVPQDVVVAVVMFCMSLPLAAGTMWQALRRPLPVSLAVGINYVLLPLAAWPLSWLLPQHLDSGLLIAAAVPCTLASAAAWTRRAGGNDTIALMVTMVTNLACFVVTPMWLLATTGQEVQIEPLEMMQQLMLLVVAPTLLAQVLRLWPPLGSWATRHKIPFGVVAQLGILSIVFVGSVRSGLQLRSAGDAAAFGYAAWGGMIAVVLGLHLAMLALGHFISRLLGISREDRIAVGFAGSQKTLMIGLHIATRYYSPLAMLPMVTFHVGQLLVDTLIADRLRGGDK